MLGVKTGLPFRLLHVEAADEEEEEEEQHEDRLVEQVDDDEAAGDGADEQEDDVVVPDGEFSSRFGIHSRPSMRLSSSVCL